MMTTTDIVGWSFVGVGLIGYSCYFIYTLYKIRQLYKV